MFRIYQFNVAKCMKYMNMHVEINFFHVNTTLSKLLGSNVTHYLRVMYLAHENHTNI